MNPFIHYIFICILGLLIATGCKSTRTNPKTELKSMPDSFHAMKDSGNIADVNWRTYFSDSNLVALADEALNNNPDGLIALQKIEAARAQVRQAKGARLPVISGVLSGGQRRYGLYTMDGAGNISTEITPGQIVPINLPDFYMGLQTSWEVDVWGKLRNRKKAAVARYLESVEGRNLVVTNLIAEVAVNYYELLALDMELDIIRETILLQENALELVRAQKSAGVANELAVKQFEGQLLDSKAMEKDVQQRMIECESAINLLLGRFPQPVARDKESFLKPFSFQSSAGIPANLLKNRPDIRQAEYGLMSSKANVKAARAAFYPTLNITAAVGLQAFNTEYLFTTPQSIAYTLLGGLTAPLINRSAIKAEFRQANAAQLEAMYEYQKTVLNGYVEVYNEVARIENLKQMYELKKQQTDVQTESIEISSELFRTGRANYIEVLMTQRSLLEARLELVSTRQQQYNSAVNMYKALGGGWQK